MYQEQIRQLLAAFENEFVTDYDSFLQSKPSRYFIQALEDAEIVTFNLSALQNAYNQSQNWERFGRMIAEQSYKLTTQRVGHAWGAPPAGPGRFPARWARSRTGRVIRDSWKKRRN